MADRMVKIDEIVLATTNRGKLEELGRMLGGCSVKLSGLGDFAGVGDVAESGVTFAENARQKARHYGGLLGRWVLADDSGLQVDAIDLAPGVYSARFAGVEGPGRDEANNKKLLECLSDVPIEKRTARFCCCLCLLGPDGTTVEVDGVMEGVIIDSPRGSNGFGYDPVFYVPAKGKTVAEMSREEKNEISHRGEALRKLVGRLCEMLIF